MKPGWNMEHDIPVVCRMQGVAPTKSPEQLTELRLFCEASFTLGLFDVLRWHGQQIPEWPNNINIIHHNLPTSGLERVPIEEA